MIEDKQIKSLIVEKTIAVDLNNYLCEEKDLNGKVKTENIEILEDELKKIGYSKIILICSSNFMYRVNKPEVFENLVDEKRIWKAPALEDTDWYILKVAKISNCDILSNDKFRDYWEEFGKEWIMEKRKTFMLIEGKLIIKN